MREEEIPQRIAFVSDRVSAPSSLQARLWQAFLRPSFAAAALVAVAILAHGFMVRPAASAGSAAVNATAMQAAVTAQIEKEVSARVDAAVSKAVADTEQREEKKTAELLADAEKRFGEQRREDFATAAANFDMLRKQVVQMYAVNTGAGVR
jgi:hypothetical protein